MEYRISEALIAALVPAKAAKPRKLGYIVVEGETALSFSRLRTFYACPRKFQLKEISEAGMHEPTIHTAFGSAFGAGLQELWRTGSLARAYLAAHAAWDYPALEDIWGKAKAKSMFHVFESLRLYESTVYSQQACIYQLPVLDFPSIETFVYISFGNRYNYQVHIDLILQNKVTQELTVTEIKTSSKLHQAAHWQNSLQTDGYFAVVKAIGAKYNLPVSNEKIYICLQTGKLDSMEDNYGFHVFHFHQVEDNNSFNLTLLQDISTIEMYRQDQHFPKRGESCIDSYNNVCEFFGSCDKIPNKVSLGNLYEPLTINDAHLVLSSEELICRAK